MSIKDLFESLRIEEIIKKVQEEREGEIKEHPILSKLTVAVGRINPSEKGHGYGKTKIKKMNRVMVMAYYWSEKNESGTVLYEQLHNLYLGLNRKTFYYGYIKPWIDLGLLKEIGYGNYEVSKTMIDVLLRENGVD